MKALIMGFIASIFIFIKPVYGLDIAIGPTFTSINDKSIESKSGVELSVKLEEDNITPFIKISYDKAKKHLWGQTTGVFNLSSIRIGTDIPLSVWGDISLMFDFGYYYPGFNFTKGSGREGVYAEMHVRADRVNGGRWRTWKPGDICCESTDGIDYIYNTCLYEVNGNFGGNFGINYTHFWHRFGVLTGVRYRYLKLPSRMIANIKGLPKEEWGSLHNGLPYHTFTEKEDLSGFQFFAELIIKF